MLFTSYAFAHPAAVAACPARARVRVRVRAGAAKEMDEEEESALGRSWTRRRRLVVLDCDLMSYSQQSIINVYK